MKIAVTRGVSAAIDRCALTHASRQPIDLERARSQHAAYEQRLAETGCSIVRLPRADDLPDSVFVEDAAVVFAELAVITRPGAPSRLPETTAVADALRAFRPLRRIEPPATLDGGDVLVIGRHVFVGRSRRTSAEAVAQVERLLDPYGYAVHAVPVRGCLHLKSAVTAVSDEALLVKRQWVPVESFRSFDLIDVDAAEPGAANALRVGDQVIYPSSHPRTCARLEGAGIRVLPVDIGELAKAEGAVTCCSLVFDAPFSLLRSKSSPIERPDC